MTTSPPHHLPHLARSPGTLSNPSGWFPTALASKKDMLKFNSTGAERVWTQTSQLRLWHVLLRPSCLNSWNEWPTGNPIVFSWLSSREIVSLWFVVKISDPHYLSGVIAWFAKRWSWRRSHCQKTSFTAGVSFNIRRCRISLSGEKFSTKMFEVKAFQTENENNNKLPALLYLNFNFLSKAFSTILDKWFVACVTKPRGPRN